MSTFVMTVRQSIYESFVIEAKTPQAAAHEAKKKMGEANWDEDDFEYEIVGGAEVGKKEDYDTVLAFKGLHD
tara:strand:+ start:2257 stop:2472 length:216 start_codon:yes stop_codon:yes gene_type:complete